MYVLWWYWGERFVDGIWGIGMDVIMAIFAKVTIDEI